MTIKLVLADDHPIVRQGLRRLLEADPEFQVMDEAGDGLETVRMVERIRPDVLIVDLMMPGLNGMEVTRQVRQYVPTTRIVVLSMHQDEGYVIQAFRSGAMAYVLKESTPTELAQAIHDVLHGDRYLSKKLAGIRLDQADDQVQGDVYDQLSDREREVLQMVAEGRSSPEIAAMLSLSRRTVESHRASLMHKMGFANTSDLIRFALKRGIISLD